jgi:predicted AlkP superfamily pyrophosphatase or phosphodiesterase
MKYLLIALVLIGLTAKSVMAAIKPGVDFGDGIKPTTQRIIDVAELVFSRYGITPTITSAMDGSHMANSKHYSGDALDWRIWESDAQDITDVIVMDLKYQLGGDYDVILESDHIHIEYDPS